MCASPFLLSVALVSRVYRDEQKRDRPLRACCSAEESKEKEKEEKKNVRKGTKKKKEGRKGKRERRTQYIVGGYLRRKRHEQQIDGRPPGPE